MSPDALFPNGLAHYFLGGLLIGAGVALLFVTTGLIGGVSTFFSATWSFVAKAPFFRQERLLASRNWRLAYAFGLLLGAALFVMFVRHAPVVTHVTWWQLLLGGFIAGFGARLSNGCTSGHGVCGIGSLQLPSVLAVLTFIATAMVTARVVRLFGGI